VYTKGWPESYICTVYDRIFGNFPAKNTVYTPYTYGSGQPYIYTVHVRQKIHGLYGYTQCIYTVLANANCEPCQKSRPGLVRAVPGISLIPSHARICIMHQHLQCLSMAPNKERSCGNARVVACAHSAPQTGLKGFVPQRSLHLNQRSGIARFRLTWGPQRPDYMSDRPVTGPWQSAMNPYAQEFVLQRLFI